MLRLLDLCSGIGGFPLGLIAADLHHAIAPVQFVERDCFCQSVLRRWFPNISIHSDLETFHSQPATFDLLTCGFPCQPHSLAGDMNGETDDRNLWPQVYRIIQETKPIGFILENVPGIRHSNNGNFFRGILRDIAIAGYVCEWDTLSIKSLGGVHERERIFLVAYSQSQRRNNLPPAIASKERTNQTPKPLCSSAIPTWTQTIATSFGVDDGLAPWLDKQLLTHKQLPTALKLGTICAEKKDIAPQLQAIGNAICPQVAAIAWNKLYERITT